MSAAQTARGSFDAVEGPAHLPGDASRAIIVAAEELLAGRQALAVVPA